MAVRRGGATPSKVFRGTVPVKKIMRGTVEVWSSTPTVTITGTSGYDSRDQFRQACIDYGTTYDVVETLPFALDTSQATNLNQMFFSCSALTSVPDMDTSNVTTTNAMFMSCPALTSVPDLDTSKVTNAATMFFSCTSLTDGNVRLIGKHPSVNTTNMITMSGLTRLPFYDSNGNPI